MADKRWRVITDNSLPDVVKDRYFISEYGEVYDSLNDRMISIFTDDEGYYRVNLATYTSGFKSRYIHRLVKIEFDGFDPDPMKDQVDHKDCDKSHNYPSNLEWVTREENAKRGIKNNLYPQISVVISEEDVELVCRLLKEGKSYKSISDILYPKYKQDMVRIIGKIYRGENWKNISAKYRPFPKLEKEKVVPSNAILNDLMVEEICKRLQDGFGITETARYIEGKYNLSIDLENAIGFIKRGKTWRHISSKYNFYNGGITMAKEKNQELNFEESIRSYGDKIEHIDTFVEAVRRFPGKLYCSAYQKW